MRTLCLLLVGVVVGWAASGVDWSREALGQEPGIDAEAIEGEALADEPASVPDNRGERSVRRQGEGILRRRGILPTRETPAPAEAPPYVPTSDAPTTPTGQPPYGPPDFDQIDATAMRRLPAPQPNLLGRFQVSAYGSPSGHGCYIVDTMTGRTWHVANGQPPQVVACVGAQSAVNSEPAYTPTPAANHPGPMIAPTPSYTESTPEPGTVNRPTPQSNVVPLPIPKLAEPTPDAAD